VTLTPHLILVPWSRKSRATPLLLLWAVLLVEILSACKRVKFTLIFYKEVIMSQARTLCSVCGRTDCTKYAVGFR